MQRALIIGSSGAGKSIFARKLAEVTGLPLVYLDLLWHRADKTTVPREEFDAALRQILARERWIIDGNFQRTLEMRLRRCDTVFLFDLPVAECLAGVEARIGSKRPEMPWIETAFDPDFRQWIIDFPVKRLPGIMALLAEAKCRVIIFKSRLQADEFIRSYRT